MKTILKKFQPEKRENGFALPGYTLRCPPDWMILVPGHFCLFFSSEEEANKTARAMTLAYRVGRKGK